MALISLILPSYNVIGYIRQCIESVIDQTMSDVEILCIDAGSSDGTYEILKEYAKKDTRIQLICSEKKSYGYQVNIGISLAKGKYVGVVETDDYIEPDMCEVLYELMEEETIDFAKGRALYCYDLSNKQTYHVARKEKITSLYKKDNETVTIEPEKFPDIIWYDYYLWNGLYSSELIKQICLNETPGAAYQDTGFMYQLYTKAKKGKFINRIVYHYRKTNKEASAYDTRALSNLCYEYDHIFRSEAEPDAKWKRVLAMKMFLQIRKKIYLMGYQERYWSEADADIKYMRDIIRLYMNVKDLPDKYQGTASLFLDDPRKLYEKYKSMFREKKINLSKMLTFASEREIVIFGASSSGRLALTLLTVNGIEPLAVCDNSEKKQGEKWEDRYLIMAPKEVFDTRPDLGYIVTAMKKSSAAAIEEQLIGMGAKRDSIFTYNAGTSAILLLDY